MNVNPFSYLIEKLKGKVDKSGDTMTGELKVDTGTSTDSIVSIGGSQNYGALRLKAGTTGKQGTIITSALTANRNYILPDKGGTVALKKVKNVTFTYVNYGMWRSDATNECIVTANSGNYHIVGGQGEYYRILKYNSGSPVPEDASNSPVTIECTLI